MDARTRRFTQVTGSAEAVLGYPVERWRAVPGFWIGVLHPEDRERVAAAIWRVMRDRQDCEIEYRAVAADGAVVRLKDRVRAVADPAGGGLRLQGTITDLTGRRVVPAAAAPPRRWRRGRYHGPAIHPPPLPPPAPSPVGPPVRALAEVEPPVTGFSADRLLNAVGEAVIASDADHRIVYWNPAAEALLGWPSAEAVGRIDSELLQTRTDAGQTAEIVAGLLGRRPWAAEVRVRARDGSVVPVRIAAAALRSDGAVVGYVAVVTDLRDVRRGESRRSAAAAMEAVSRLARGVADELNDGVARIEAAVRNALARTAPDDDSREHLDDALRTVDATAALAAQLMAVGRAVTTRPARTGLADIVRRGMPAIRLLAADRVEIETRLDLDHTALVDPVVASQILLNIAANACAAMPDGGRLAISTSAMDLPRAGVPPGLGPGRWVVLEVADSRPPLDAALLDRIFEPYNDVALPPGMALAVAHGLAAASGGAIDARVVDGNGLAFRAFFRSAEAAGG